MLIPQANPLTQPVLRSYLITRLWQKKLHFWSSPNLSSMQVEF